MIDRRTLLGGGGAALLGACVSRAARRIPPAVATTVDHLAHAEAAALYLRAHQVETAHGLTWRKSPDEPGVMERDLYYGSSGPSLFFLELHRATGDTAALDAAVRGTAHVIAALPESPNQWQVGLFGGLAGYGALLLAVAATTGDARYRTAAADMVARLARAATPGAGGGVEYPLTDVLFGSAGVILWLLEAAAALPGDRAATLAVALGDGLLRRAEPTTHGTRWLMTPADDIELPNFSHGTAGVAFALARLHQVTGEARFLDAALAGARHLLGIADTDGGVCLIPHILPGGEGRHYLGYCHGPAGTSRLFHQLHTVTGDAVWNDWFERSVAGVLHSGVPETRTPGFWDNVGQCCGTAGLAELMLSVHRLRADDAFLALAERLAADIVARATPSGGGGVEWVHAENRAEPYWKQSYTGYMQGAAGIGSLMIRLAGHRKRRTWKVRFPDNPFPV